MQLYGSAAEVLAKIKHTDQVINRMRLDFMHLTYHRMTRVLLEEYIWAQAKDETAEKFKALRMVTKAQFDLILESTRLEFALIRSRFCE